MSEPQESNLGIREETDSTSKMPMAIVLGCAGLALVATVFIVGFGAGFGVGRYTAKTGPEWFESAHASDSAVECNRKPAKGAASQLFPEFGIFWEAMDLLYDEYYGTLPESDEAVHEAIRGVIGLLDDPNTSLLTPEEAAYYRTNIEGEFEGIGARVGWDEDANTLVITEPFVKQPAWQAGLRRGDLVYAVDGTSIIGIGLSEAVDMIRGPKGSTVTLTVVHPDGAESFEVQVVRDRIDIPTIFTDAVGEDGEIAYIRLSSFNDNAGQLTIQAVEDAVQRDPSAIILDLRGNTGGLLREAVTVSSVFLDDEVVLYERFNDGDEEVYRTEGEPVTTDLPLVLLVNEGSASASEIVAGALQDHDRATIIGTTTYGKGSVQLPHTLSNEGIIRITIARWLTPDKHSINGVGLEPDIRVQPPDKPGGSEDPQLDAAVKYIEQSTDIETTDQTDSQ